MQLHVQLESFSTDKHVFKHTEGEDCRKCLEWPNCAYGLPFDDAIDLMRVLLALGLAVNLLSFSLMTMTERLSLRISMKTRYRL